MHALLRKTPQGRAHRTRRALKRTSRCGRGRLYSRLARYAGTRSCDGGIATSAKTNVSRAGDAAPAETAPADAISSAGAAPVHEQSVSLRPGVLLPDWSLARANAARIALASIAELVGIGTAKWSSLGVAEDRVWRCVVEQIVALGRAPTLGEISDATGFPPSAVAEELKKLRARDVVVLDGDERTLRLRGRVRHCRGYSRRDRECGTGATNLSPTNGWALSASVAVRIRPRGAGDPPAPPHLFRARQVAATT